MRFELGIANGTGYCKICGKRIKKGTKQLIAWEWKASGRAHKTCILKLLRGISMAISVKDIPEDIPVDNITEIEKLKDKLRV